jgi:hypothetical protein
MAQVNKIDSNATELRISEETSFKVADGSAVWKPYEPNSYDDTGGEITTIARNPINSSRQRKKGVLTDLDATAGFQTDLTQTNVADLLQGFFYADFRRKGEEVPTQATATTDLFSVASTAGFQVNDLIWVTGFVNSANNGLHVITAIVANVSIEVLGSTLVTETPPATANIVNVGHRAGAGDIDVDITGDYATYTSTTLDFTTLGIIPGEMVYVGGDAAANRFTTSANNGFKRVKSVAASALVVDKSESAMATEASTTELIDIYLGRVLKNESAAASQVRRTYQVERSLGAPDDASPAQIQAEYIVGAVPSEMVMNIGTADKITLDLSFIAGDQETIDGPTSLKAGTRPAVVESDAFNTSSDFSRLKMAVHSANSEAPTALFAYLTELTLTLNNNLSANKAVSVLGAFDVSAGTFQVDGSMSAYFGNVSAIDAIRANSSVTIDLAVSKNNAGIAVDLPLITLGDGKLEVEQDEPVIIPLSSAAATGAGVDANMDHTMLMVFFDYLPTLSETV